MAWIENRSFHRPFTLVLEPNNHAQVDRKTLIFALKAIIAAAGRIMDSPRAAEEVMAWQA